MRHRAGARRWHKPRLRTGRRYRQVRGIRERMDLARGDVERANGAVQDDPVVIEVGAEDAAVIAAATLSHRYITDRFLPDKAIDLIDEAAARLRTEIDSKPQALDIVDRDIMQLEIERQALKKEKDKEKVRLQNLINGNLLIYLWAI